MLGWVLVAGSVYLGYTHRAWWTPLTLVAGMAVLLVAAAVLSNSITLIGWPARFAAALVVQTAACYGAYGAGRLARALLDRLASGRPS